MVLPELLYHLGPVLGATLLQPDNVTPLEPFHGLRLGVSCFERSQVCLHFMKSLRFFAASSVMKPCSAMYGGKILNANIAGQISPDTS
eukprot:2950351-Rhodomonas_salina.2